MNNNFDFKCYNDDQLMDLAAMQEIGIDSIIVQDLILLYYGVVSEEQKISLRSFIALKSGIIFLLEDEMRKRNIIDKYRENMYLPDYRTSKKTYKSYSERINDLCKMAFEGILSPRGVNEYYMRMNQEAYGDETKKNQEKTKDREKKLREDQETGKYPKKTPNNKELLN